MLLAASAERLQEHLLEAGDWSCRPCTLSRLPTLLEAGLAAGGLTAVRRAGGDAGAAVWGAGGVLPDAGPVHQRGAGEHAQPGCAAQEGVPGRHGGHGQGAARPCDFVQNPNSLHVRNTLGLQPRQHPCTLGKGGPRQVTLVLQPIFDLSQRGDSLPCRMPMAMMLSEHAPYPTPARWAAHT